MDAFLEAWVHSDHRVCGYRMKPYSASRVLALSAFKSPFAVGRRATDDADEMTPAAVLLAAKVCAAEDPLTYQPKATLRDRLWYLLMRLSPLHFLGQVEALNAYVSDYFTLPETWESVPDDGDDFFEDDRKVRGPWVLSRIASLISQTSTTLREALSMPLGQLFWLDAALAELRGGQVFVEREDFDGLQDEVPAETVAMLEKRRAELIREKRRKQRDGR